MNTDVIAYYHNKKPRKIKIHLELVLAYPSARYSADAIKILAMIFERY